MDQAAAILVVTVFISAVVLGMAFVDWLTGGWE